MVIKVTAAKFSLLSFKNFGEFDYVILRLLGNSPWSRAAPNLANNGDGISVGLFSPDVIDMHPADKFYVCIAK